MEKYKRILSYVFAIFMILQPLFDIFYLYDDNLIAMFKFSPATIIRMGVMSLLFLFTFLYWKNKNKWKYLIVFCVIYLLYTIFHQINVMNFDVPFDKFNNYSTLKELFYIIRMVCPLLMIFVTYENDIRREYLKKIIIYVSLIFSVVMVSTNLLGIALGSYDGGTEIIERTIIDWFNPNIYNEVSYTKIASKGIFHMANQVSATLISLLPMVIYYLLKEKKALYGLTYFLMLLSMLMIGTRVAGYGWLLVSACMFVAYLFFVFVKKEYKFDLKISVIYLILTAINCVILPYSPVMNRHYIEENAGIINENQEKDHVKNYIKEFEKFLELTEDEDAIYDKKIEFLVNMKDVYGFDPEYFNEIYPYEQDPDFWLKLAKMDYVNRANHRNLKTHITHRVIDLNDNKMDYVLGVGFSRLRNVPCYMENDIYVHIYSIGIVGILVFIAPYFVILMYGVYSVFKDYKNKFTFLNISLLFSIVLTFVAGIFSGNVFDEWICTLFLGFMCGCLLLNLKKKES
ncbi:MAG: O-antigen ligase family protein [Bacilli bacterium]